MKLFSHRRGLKPVKSTIQIDSIDSDLRNGLWSAVCLHYWESVTQEILRDSYSHTDQALYILCRRLWLHYFKFTIDTLSKQWNQIYTYLRKYFFSCLWNEVYDFVEFVALNHPDEFANGKFRDTCNAILERELSAFRFVGGKISAITSDEEIETIKLATESTDSLQPAAIHFRRALEFLSDRKAPDYRNSIKESISAVEPACKLLTGDPKADLCAALKDLKKKVSFHPALEKAFVHLYGYTSDEQGIRHALIDESQLNFEDAKFMLVSRSAFLNYLKAKAIKAGVRM